MSKSFLYGIHPIETLLTQQPQRIVELYIQAQRDDHKMQQIKMLAKTQNVSVRLVAKEELDRLTQRAPHQGVAALCGRAKSYSEADLQDILSSLTTPAFFLILDCF